MGVGVVTRCGGGAAALLRGVECPLTDFLSLVCSSCGLKQAAGVAVALSLPAAAKDVDDGCGMTYLLRLTAGSSKVCFSDVKSSTSGGYKHSDHVDMIRIPIAIRKHAYSE